MGGIRVSQIFVFHGKFWNVSPAKDEGLLYILYIQIEFPYPFVGLSVYLEVYLSLL